MVGVTGFEPAAPMLPKHVRYRAALHPDNGMCSASDSISLPPNTRFVKGFD